MKLTSSRLLPLTSVLCGLALFETGCHPVLLYVLDAAVDAGLTLCATKGGEFLNKEFDQLMDQFMGKVGPPKHSRSEALGANGQHPALLVDPRDPNRAIGLGFTTIRYGGKHGAQGCTAQIENAHFIKRKGHWMLDPQEKERAIALLTERLH
jgi:hypothetical protein